MKDKPIQMPQTHQVDGFNPTNTAIVFNKIKHGIYVIRQMTTCLNIFFIPIFLVCTKLKQKFKIKKFI